MAREQSGHTLTATALVHEAYQRLVGSGKTIKWDNQGHFFAAAAEAMRRILIEVARKKKAVRHGGDRQKLELNTNIVTPESDAFGMKLDMLDFEEALTKYEQEYPKKAILIKLRFFAGLSILEASQCLEVSEVTAKRYWAFSKAWLYEQLHQD